MRGDVYRVAAPRGTRGHEQRGPRYGVVVQSDLLMSLSTWLIAPTSRSANPASFRPEIEVEGETTRILVEQTTAVDPERLGDLVGHLSHEELADMETGLRIVLGL